MSNLWTRLAGRKQPAEPPPTDNADAPAPVANGDAAPRGMSLQAGPGFPETQDVAQENEAFEELEAALSKPRRGWRERLSGSGLATGSSSFTRRSRNAVRSAAASANSRLCMRRRRSSINSVV
ncbi:MAG TPA: hypothetical protein VJ722_06215, partial [Rhodanobacteraceae bacterium]|nr:hypothetical protein [Rhodanobacteraceae bacterium]